jgi:tetratricopeptide (TPR) repeat protein
MQQRRVRIGLALGLWIGTAALFWPIHSHDFVRFDDPQYVSNNFLLEDGLSADGIRRAFSIPYYFNWHPLTTLSYAVDYRFHGRVAGGYLATNLLLHATTTLLLFLALERLTGALGRSAFVAATFGIHPLHVESVAWVSERKDVLSAVFFAALLLVYAGGGARPPTGARRLAICTLLVLGLLAKPMLVTVPCVLLLLDFWPLRRIPVDALGPALRSLGVLVVEKLPLFLLAAASSVITYVVQSTSGAVQTLDQFPLASRLLNVPLSYVEYVERAFWPLGLAFFYPMTPELSLRRGLLATAPLAMITLAAFLLRRRAPYLLMGWLWFLGMLVPVIGLVQVGSQSMADRYTYLPLIGLAIAFAWGTVDLFGARSAARLALGGVAVATLAALAWASSSQIDTWRNDESMAAHALKVTTPSNLAAHFILAGAMLDQGRTEEARTELETTLRLRPSCWECHSLLGDLLEKEGLPEQAVSAYYDALRLNPTSRRARASLAQLLIDLRRPDEALTVLEKVSSDSRESGGPEIHMLMGRALEARDDLAGAAEQYETSLRLWPRFPEAHANLGVLLAKQNRLPESESHLRRANALGLDTPELHSTLGETLQREGRPVEAAAEFRSALRSRPNWSAPNNNLAWILATEQDPQLRHPEEAVPLAEAAVQETRREDPSMLDTLAVAYAAAGRRADALATAREALGVARAQQRSELIPVLERRVRSYENEASASGS